MPVSGSTINRGNQKLSFDYRQEARAKIFNRFFSQVVPTGIYSGAVLTRLNDTQVAVAPDSNAPTVLLAKDANEDGTLNQTVRVEATENIQWDLDDGSNPGYANPNKPYIVLRFAWADVENNYLDIKSVAYSNDPGETDEAFILPTDIIVGKVLFEEETPASGNYIIRTLDSFDLTRRNNAFIPDSSTAFRELRVQAPEGANLRKVYVSSGSINTSGGRKEVSGGHYPTATDITDTAGFGRIDIVYVDESGDIKIEEGEASASPVAPLYLNRKVLGEINRGPNRNSIEGPDIRQVNVTRQGMISSDEFLIKNIESYYTPNALGRVTIEMAFDEIFELYSAILAGPGISDDTVKDYHIDWGTAADQVSAADMPIEDAATQFTATDTEGALAEVKAQSDTHISSEADTVTVHGINVVTEII
jgi:hypothetical protein